MPSAHGDWGDARCGAVCEWAALAETRAVQRIEVTKAKRIRSTAQNVKACVIGGSGFLGSHTCDHLSAAGYVITILDRIASP